MKTLDINYDDIESCSKYLISRFFKTGCKYKCYRSKINGLLTIFELCRMKHIDKSNDYYNFKIDINNNMYGFPFVFDKLEKDLYYYWLCVDEDGQKINDNFDETIEVPQEYVVNPLEVGFYSKKILDEIFRNFGNYSRYDLDRALIEILKKVPTIKYNIDIYKFQSFVNDNINTIHNNKIFNFIKAYTDTESINSTQNLYIYRCCDLSSVNEYKEKKQSKDV